MNDLLEIPTFLRRKPGAAPSREEAEAEYEKCSRPVPVMPAPRCEKKRKATYKKLKRLGFTHNEIDTMWEDERQKRIADGIPHVSTKDILAEFDAKVEEAARLSKGEK